MKVILIKDCKDGKKHEVIDVTKGYATNFLIKQKFALPYNEKTKLMNNKIITQNNEKEAKNLANAKKIKKIIENLKLSFSLLVTNMVIHGSITRKQIIKELAHKGIKLNNNCIHSIIIKSLGITIVDVKLHKDVIAKLKIEVKEDGK